jgi:hypothetical protein
MIRVQTPEPEAAAREAIRHWRRLPELADFAVCRHGFGDSDGGFGVIYPGDLDEYARVVERTSIPERSVQVYGFWGPPDGYELLVDELAYLRTLANVLSEAGHAAEAARVRSFADNLRHAEQEVSPDCGGM